MILPFATSRLIRGSWESASRWAASAGISGKVATRTGVEGAQLLESDRGQEKKKTGVARILRAPTRSSALLRADTRRAMSLDTIFDFAQTGHLIGFLSTKYQIVRGARHSLRVSGAARGTLLAMLPAAEQEVRIAELEESVAQKDEELAAKDKELASLRDGDVNMTAEGATGAAVETDESESLRAQMAAKDAELARVKAELASLRALLPPPAPSEEDVPPYS